MSDIKLINVGGKESTHRVATAQGSIEMKKETFGLCIDKKLPKGDVFACSKVAGYMAAKNTSGLLPLCHPIAITHMGIDFDTSVKGIITVKTTVEGFDRTGVEMEALTAASVALLTIYDMCKTVDQSMTIKEIFLVEKKGGKSGHYLRNKKIV
ncbi:MAG: cyclic pyranopterin monophosphate synthase MoaC [Planctomycetes bacterium]|nr:cyclic pyranopterin monophosphate synthase MoaC [Planctomycetota bacterium]